MIQFAIIGTGWRAEFFLRIARACPAQFKIVGIVGRNAAKAAEIGQRFHVPVYPSIEALVTQGKPAFVVLSINRGANLPVLTQLAQLNMPVLVETPPAETIDELRQTWQLVANDAKIQVAEQYWAQPHHAARLAFAHSGKLGKITQAQISVAHGYHGISLMRRFLDVNFEPVTVTAARFTSPLVEGPDRNGLPAQQNLTNSKQEFARFDFGDKLGLYDFTGDQYFSLIRGQRVLVRGDRGEIVDERAVYLQDYRTPIQVSFLRQSAGINGNLEGNYLKGIQAGDSWVYTNPLLPAALPDEEIAIGTCLMKMAAYVNSGVSFYSFAEAAQDRYLDLLMAQALESNQAVRSEIQPWQQG